MHIFQQVYRSTLPYLVLFTIHSSQDLQSEFESRGLNSGPSDSCTVIIHPRNTRKIFAHSLTGRLAKQTEALKWVRRQTIDGMRLGETQSDNGLKWRGEMAQISRIGFCGVYNLNRAYGNWWYLLILNL